MPTASQNGFDANEFARVMARFDTGNPSEAEAMNAARLLRRMVASNGLRFVDVMERSDVKQALDAQLQVVREENVELKAAFEKVTELAELLAEERKSKAALERQLVNICLAGGGASTGLVNGALVAVVVIVAGALMIAALAH
jgi:hypothetical protein